MTKALCFALILSLVAGAASAQTATCHSRATDKSLHGAAETSFLKKCEKDASASCTASAAEKKLHGAAKSSFVKKCVKDAVGG
jgi:hypothetical protein